MNNFTALSILIVILSAPSSSYADANRWQGQPFAKFNLQDQAGKFRSNRDFDGKWMVIYFYPKDRTPGCTLEAQNFVNDYHQYQLLNVEIIGVSYDDTESHKDFADTYEMQFTLLADVDRELSKAMDVDRILPWPHPSRQTFVVDPEGIIVKHYEDVSPKTHSNQLLKHLKQLINVKKKAG